MSSLPQPSTMPMPPLERSHTDLSPSTSDHMSSFPDRVSPHTYRAAPVYNSMAYQQQNPHLFQPQQYSYLPTPPYASPAPYPYFNNPYPIPNIPGAMPFQPDFSVPQPYYGAMPLPTIPPRFSSSNPIDVPGGGATGCISPLDLFGALPSAQSLPNSAIPSAFGGRSLGLGQEQMYLDDAVELEDEVEAETTSAPELAGLEDSPLFSEASSMGMEEIEEEPQAQVDPVTEKVERAKKGRKIRPAVPFDPMAMELASPPMKHKIQVETTPGDGVGGKEGKKRSRTAQACERCRIRKARCFGGNPCNRCIKRKFTCEFTPTSARTRTLNVKPDTPSTTAAVTKPKARRHSMHTMPSTVPAVHAPTLPNPSHPAKSPRASSAARVHGHQHHHSHSMSMPRPRFELSAVHPHLRPQLTPTTSAGGSIAAAAHALHNATVGSDAGLAPAPSQLGLSFDGGLGLGLGLNLGLDFTPSEEDASADPSPAAESDSMPSMTNSFSASGSSAPTSNSGTGDTSGCSSLFNTTEGTTATPVLIGEEDMFSFSPVQVSEMGQLQMDWAAGGEAFGVSGLGVGGPAAGLDQGVCAPGMEWYNQPQSQSAGFRA